MRSEECVYCEEDAEFDLGQIDEDGDFWCAQCVDKFEVDNEEDL